MTEQNGFKICLIGSGGVGKSAFLQRHRTGEFERKYIPTCGVNVLSLKFQTNYGEILFDCWDTAGQEKFGGLFENYYLHSKGAIIMFDLTSRVTYAQLDEWIRQYTRIASQTPVVFCGNKCDLQREIIPTDIDIHRKMKSRGMDCAYYDVSAKGVFNCEKPFLWLARKLTGHEDLEFVAGSV